jgi:hypothetical protein
MGIVPLNYITAVRPILRRHMSTEKIMDVKGGGQRLTLEQLRGRMSTYQTEIRDFLESHEATVETYRFSVDKEGDGFSVEVMVKASIHPKNKTGISK